MWPAACEAGHRVHQHREEGHHHDDRGLRLPVEAEPHDHDRRDADDRQARPELPSGSSPRRRNGERSISTPTRKPAREPMPSRPAPLQEGLDEIGARAWPKRCGERVARSRLGAGSSTRGTPKRSTQELPEHQHSAGAEEQSARQDAQPEQRACTAAQAPRAAPVLASTTRSRSSQARRRSSTSQRRATAADAPPALRQRATAGRQRGAAQNSSESPGHDAERDGTAQRGLAGSRACAPMARSATPLGERRPRRRRRPDGMRRQRPAPTRSAPSGRNRSR